ncbi:MAG: hypothetical protein H7249_15545 [Chitinophagaceae bacterium]|nr:hypothetical protein [Oligoflexus sp.]
MYLSKARFQNLSLSLALSTGVIPAALHAQEKTDTAHEKLDTTKLTEDEAKEPGYKPKIEVSGYGEIIYKYSDFGPNQRASTRGSKRDQRVDLDMTRFAIELEAELARGFKLEAELEIEHGGTGSAVDLEYEEGGEYENDVEKGGEVAFENLFLEKSLGNHRLRIGKFPVALGLLPDHHDPLDFLGAVRPESESHIIPNNWSEIGIDYAYKTPLNTYALQLVNGLDSTGFSSQEFIVGGFQQKFMSSKATDPAFVARWSTRLIPGLDTGFSLYYGETSRNRPQSDLVKKCASSSVNADAVNNVAPCPYVKAPVTLIAWEAAGEWDKIRLLASALQGKIKNAAEINARNANLSTKYVGILRSAVAERAYAAWAEAGYSFVGYESDDRITPFVRYEQYDTIDKPAPGQADVDRFDRRVWTLGADYQFAKSVIIKIDTARRTFVSKNLRAEDEVRINTSFMF